MACSYYRQTTLAGNLSDLTVASSLYDILLCSETLASDMRALSGHTGSALAYPWTYVRALVAAKSLMFFRPRLHRAIHGVQGVLPMRVGGVTSQFDLPSLTPLSVAGRGRLQLGVPHWATSVITASR